MAPSVLSCGLTEQNCPHNRGGPGTRAHPGGHEGRRAKGRLRGKQPKLSAKQEAHLVKLHGAGEHTIGELEELFGVTRSTMYRALARGRARAEP